MIHLEDTETLFKPEDFRSIEPLVKGYYITINIFVCLIAIGTYATKQVLIGLILKKSIIDYGRIFCYYSVLN